MVEPVTVQIGRFVGSVNEERKALIKRVVHQTVWLIGCSQ